MASPFLVSIRIIRNISRKSNSLAYLFQEHKYKCENEEVALTSEG